jgi:hypothetical protein
LLLSLHCYRYSRYDVDLLGYAGNVALAQTHDIVKAHRLVYREPLTPHLRGQDDTRSEGLRLRASDPYYSALFLPFFSIKPLYLLILELVSKLGFSVVDCSRIVSALAYFGIACMLWVYSRSPLAVLILLLPETMVLGQANEPDGLSTFLILLGLWMLFLRNNDLGLLPLMATIWIRPENVILCLVLVLMLVSYGRLDYNKAAILTCLCLGSSALISHFAYGWKVLYFHTFLSGDPSQIPYFGPADYLRAFAKGLTDLLHTPFILYSVLWAVCYRMVEVGLQRVMILAVAYSVVRFLMFPSYEARYYGLFFLVTGIAALSVISKKFRSARPWIIARDLPAPSPANLGHSLVD